MPLTLKYLTLFARGHTLEVSKVIERIPVELPYQGQVGMPMLGRQNNHLHLTTEK